MRSLLVSIAIAALLAALEPLSSFSAKTTAQSRSTNVPESQTATPLDPSQQPDDKIQLKARLVSLTVTVSDKLGRFVTGLEKRNFQIYDDGVQQEIAHFGDEDAPLTLGIIYDVSGSMGDLTSRSFQALQKFFDTSHQDDEYFIIAFNNRAQLVQDFTTSPSEIMNRVVFVKAKGSTALYDGVYLGLEKARQGRHRKKALLIISDGGDNRSRYTEGEVKSAVKEADVQIYAIGIFDAYAATDEERRGPLLLSEITEITGGRTFTVDNPNELTDVATKIGIELRNQYVIGYRPKNPTKDGKWRKIKVKLNPPKGLPPLHVYSKTGYYAPSE